MLQIAVEILGEFLIQAIGEALMELGLHSLAEPFRRPPNPWLAALGYALFGAIFGGLSLLIFSQHFPQDGYARWLNLLLTPLAVGGVMVLMGTWRTRRGKERLRINRFFYGYLFALAFAVVRWAFAQHA